MDYRSALMSGRSAAAADLAMACALPLVLLASLIPSRNAALITKYSATRNTIAPMASSMAMCIAARVASASSSCFPFRALAAHSLPIPGVFKEVFYVLRVTHGNHSD